MKNCLVVALIIALAFSVSASGQRPSPPVSENKRTQKDDQEKGDVVRLGVTLVQVDAVVTDSKGRQVTDLRPEDFEIFEDGRKQKITNFSYVLTQPSSAPANITNTTRPSGGIKTPVPPTVLRPDQVRRTIALVVDDLSLSFESTHYTREALKKFVDEQMQPGDLVAILRTGAGIGALQQFTTDKRQLYAAIERVRWNPMWVSRVGAFAPMQDSRLPGPPPALAAQGGRDQEEVLEEFRENIFSVGTLGAINFVVRGLRDLPGRKSVILFSEGFRLVNKDGGNVRFLESLRRLVDLANRASVVIYTVDTRGVQYTGLTAADNTAGLSSEQLEERLRGRREQLFETQAGLGYLAQETGGFSIRNSNDLIRGVDRVLDDQKGYYLIGYIPDDSTFRPTSGRRNFHRISMKVKRPGLQVRSRKGFYGITNEDMRAASGGRREQMFNALASPFSSGGVRLRLTPLYGHGQRGSFVHTMLHMDARDFTFTDGANGQRKAVFDVLVVMYGDNGIPIEQKGWTYTLEAPPDVIEGILQKGLIYTLVVPVKKPGAYQLRAAVRDTASERIGSANQFIEVPNLGKKRLALSGLMISGSDHASTGSLTANTTDDKDDEADTAAAQSSPALRRFSPGKDILYSLLIFNAKTKGKMPPQLETRTVLIKDGQIIFTGEPKPVDMESQKDWKVIVAGGLLNLGEDAPEGEYILQIIVTDKLADKKHNTVAQYMNFDIVR